MTRKEQNDKAMSHVAAILAARIVGSVEKEEKAKMEAHDTFTRVWGSMMPGGLPVVETQSGISVENLDKLTKLMNKPGGRIITSHG